MAELIEYKFRSIFFRIMSSHVQGNILEWLPRHVQNTLKQQDTATIFSKIHYAGALRETLI